MHSFSPRYSISCQLICDVNKCFIGVNYGFPGSCHDSTVFKSMTIYKSPENHFSSSEYLLADSAYGNNAFVVTPFKGPQATTTNATNFNYCLAQSRVRIEHAIGILKGRWHSLRELRSPLCNQKEAKDLGNWVVACIILHNMMAKLGDQWYELFEEEDPPQIENLIEAQVLSDPNFQRRDLIMPYTLQYHQHKYQ